MTEDMQRKNNNKILQIITKSNFGGAQKYVYELSTDLKKKDYDIIVAFGGNGILSQKLQKENIETRQINSLSRDINIFSDIKVFFEVIDLIKEIRPDIIHLHSSKIGVLGSLAARICFVPKIVYTIHGLAFNENRNWFSKIIIKKLYWLTIFMSHKSIAVSKYVKDEILKIPLSFILKDKIEIVRNEINPVDFYSKEESLDFISKKIGRNLDNKKIIGTIAELHHVKGINYLIDSAKKIIDKNPDTIFVVFGDGEEKENLQNQISDLKINENFFILGFVDNASKYLKGLDLFVLPSISEALALVILEAKEAGIKIVASKVGGIPEAVNNYPNAKTFYPKSVEDLTSKIKQSLEEKDNIGLFYQSNFDSMTKKIIEIYNN